MAQPQPIANPFNGEDLAGWSIKRAYRAKHFSSGTGSEYSFCTCDAYFVNDVLNFPYGRSGRFSQVEVTIITNGTIAYFLNGELVRDFLNDESVKRSRDRLKEK